MANYPEHPGNIIFVNGMTGETTKTVPAAEVPENIRYVETDEGFVPVVRIEDYAFENQLTIRQYGPDGELLQSTVMIP